MKKTEYTQAELEKGMNYLSKHPEMIDSGMKTQIKSIISPQIKSTSYNGLLQSFKRYQPEKDQGNGRLSDNRIKEIVDTTIRSALPHSANTPKNNEDINSRWNAARGKEKTKTIGDNTITSALPSIEATDYNTQVVTMSPEGHAGYLKASRAYKDAVIRYRKVVPGNIADEFLRTLPTISQLKAATKGINGASLADITKKWGFATGHKRQ